MKATRKNSLSILCAISLLLATICCFTMGHLSTCLADSASPAGICDVKSLPDGNPVHLDNSAVVYAPRDILLTRSTPYFYVVEPNRISGIRVADTSSVVDNVKPNDVVSLDGVVRTVATTNERFIELTSVPTKVASSQVEPFGVTTKAIDTDDKVVGQLVRMVGKVHDVAADGSWFTISDGYTDNGEDVLTKVVVENKLAVGAVSPNSTMTITGVVSLDGTSPETTKRVVLVRSTQSSASLPTPLISVNAATLANGTLTTWTNDGTLAGSFGNDGTTPTVTTVAGRKCVTFDSTDRMKATFTAPAGITGNGDFTYSAWLYNPAFADHESVFGWAKRGGPAFTHAEMNFGNNTSYGALSHWSADMGFSGGLPSAGAWHNVVVTFNGSVEKVFVDGVLNAQKSQTINIAAGLPVYIGCSYTMSGTTVTPVNFFSGSIASLQLYDSALSDLDVQLLYNGQAAYSISGTVKASGGSGIPGAKVYFSRSPNAAANPLYTATTDANGNYNQPVGDGTWYVAVIATGYVTPAEKTVVVSGASKTGIDFALTAIPTYAISGTVVAQNGTPIQGATVYIKNAPSAATNPQYTLTTNSSGGYSQNVTNGTWYVVASATGYDSPAEQTVVVNGAAVHNINFTLSPVVTHTITATAGTGGSISPSGSVIVNHGASKTFTIAAGSGYVITNVIVDGVGQGAINTYTFPSVVADHSILVTFTSTGGSPLVACYEFENNVNDTQGAFNGTAYGNPTFSTGKVGSYALQLNGSSQYVTIPPPISNDWTVSFFVKSNQTSRTGTGWYSGSGLFDGEVGGTANDFGITLLNDKVAFGVGNPDTTLQSTTSINTGSWMHVACTRSAATGEMKVYVNGVLEGTKTGPTGARTSPPTLHIGNLQTNANYFKGTIDQLKIFNTVLSSADINALLAEGGNTTWWMITTTGGVGGTISPGGNVSIADGESVTFTFTPDAHYSIKEVIVDGVSKGSVATYTFTNVNANHTVAVTFAQETLPGVITGPYLQAVTQNSAYVLVETNNTDPVTVEWGERAEDFGLKATDASVEPTGSTPETYVHNIKLTGLQPNRNYNYCVNVNGTKGADHEFKTLVDPGTNFRFAMYGDFKGATTVPDNINARVDTAKPLFRLYSGDLCNMDTADRFRSEFFRPAELALDAKIPFFNAPGNHENWGPAAKAFTHGPDTSSGTQDYWSFDCGDVHFVRVNTQMSYGPGSPQYNWMQADLAASKKPWKIVWSHYIPYTSTSDGHGPDPTMQAMATNVWVPNNVDMAFYCHNHFYQHNLVDGIHHMIVGSAGASLYTPTNADYTIKSVKTHCYSIVDVTPTTLDFTAYDDSGAVLETLHLTKQFTVSGKIQNSTGQGIYNAVVAVGGGEYPNIAPVVTDASGNYTINVPGPGTYDVYADAPGYAASYGTATISASGTVSSNLTLTAATETGVYNGNFETAGTGGMPDGWESFITKPSHATDYYGNPWPDKPDMYTFARSTAGNNTPGGSASGQIATASPLSNYGVLRVDRVGVSGDPCTGISESTVVVNGKTWANNYYADGATFVQLAHGGDDAGKVYPLTGDYKVISNTADTLTVAPGSNLVTTGYAVGDKFRFVREVRSYWYTAGIRTTPARRIPVDRNHVYNFYFRQKTAYTGKETEKCHVYSLVWRDAAGNELDRLAYTWNWTPGTAFTPCVPKLFLAPPAGATTAEVCISTTCVDTANSGWSDLSLIDDVVVDPVPVTATSSIKSLADNTRVIVPGNCVSLSPRDAAGERSTDYYYVSEPNGSAGIRIQNQKLKMDRLYVNDTLAVSGTVKTNASTGEKYILAGIAGTAVTTGGANPASATVASALTDANAVGNFVSVTAQVSAIASDISSFDITDVGSTIKVKSVNFPLLPEFAKVGDAIRVNGVVSKEGSNRVILMMNYSKQTTPFPDNDITFFAISDVHYGGGWATRLLHKQRLEAMNAMTGTPYPSSIGGTVGESRGVTITGDITDNDDNKAGQFAEFVMDFGLDGRNQLRYPTYEGLGNHDGGVTYPAADGIKPRNPYRPDVVNVSPDGLNYSWDWGKVHFIHTNEAGSYLNQDSLLWIQDDLATHVGTSGRPVILFQHEGFDSFSFAFYSRGESTRLYNAIKNYNVIAILWGHTGGFAQYKWGGIDVFGTDGAMNLFHVFHITQNELIVTRRDFTGKSWMPWSFRKTITGM